MANSFKKLILAGQFQAASRAMEQLPSDQQDDFIFDLAYATDNIATYGFIVMNLLDQETAFWHYTAGQLFMAVLCHVNGAESLGLYHVKQSIDIKPNHLGYKIGYLSYYGPPTYLLTNTQALQVANEIFAIDRENAHAHRALEKYPIDRELDVSRDDKDFYSLLYYGKFKEAQKLVQDLTLDELFEALTAINNRKPTLITYGYLVHLLLEGETSALHYLASRILVEQLNSIEGAYASGYWHAKRSITLDTKNLAYKNHLLKFYALPGQLLNKSEALVLAKEIVKIDPSSTSVLHIFSEAEVEAG